MCIYIESPYTYIMASLLRLVGYSIIIRYELGKDLINGKIQVKDFNVKLINRKLDEINKWLKEMEFHLVEMQEKLILLIL
ncbi:hypothetical protein KQH90_03455 [Anaerosalibacter bizertensis]|uniref:hypothetical protein n=1 Tax=Anaerosalibacter bizertensis TaxID=932217 RepID=UPI001C0F15E9|nr:hypothetical protein [Anaerosalibacter bizertensis]MBU5293092.1 hypothetical protein [Anaerosalibacter bizertensis]